MFCRVKVLPKDGVAAPEGVEELLWDFLYALARNGQICRNFTLVREDNYCAYVTLPKEDSLAAAHDGVYVKQRRAEVEKYFDLSAHISGANAESQPYCTCASHTALEMQTFSFDCDSVFTCMDCGRPVAMYELPPIEGEGDFCNIENWQENYSAMDKLWLNCLCDRYTGRQLTDPQSALNKQGRQLAAQMAQALGCKVYYNMFDDLGYYTKKPKWANEGGKMLRICPSCGKLMRHYAADNYEVELCDDCNLSSDPYEMQE